MTEMIVNQQRWIWKFGIEKFTIWLARRKISLNVKIAEAAGAGDIACARLLQYCFSFSIVSSSPEVRQSDASFSF